MFRKKTPKEIANQYHERLAKVSKRRQKELTRLNRFGRFIFFTMLYLVIIVAAVVLAFYPDLVTKAAPQALLQLISPTGDPGKPVLVNTSLPWIIPMTPDNKNFREMSSRSLALGPDQQACVAYGGEHLFLDCRSATSVISQVVDGENGVGSYASLAVDPAGHAHIAYYDETHGALRYAVWDGNTWAIAVVDAAKPSQDPAATPQPGAEDLNPTGAGVGAFASLALDSAGSPHISYYDQAQGDLKYAHFQDGSWHIELVDSQGDVGAYSSLALDASGTPMIGYYDKTNGDLKIARLAKDAWVFDRIQSPNDEGQGASLAVDSAGKPAVSFLDQTQGTLNYAFWDSAAGWKVTQVAAIGSSSNPIGSGTALAFDAKGQAHLAYYDFSKQQLKLATLDGADWHIATPDSDGDVGRYPSLAVDPTGRTHLVYFDATHAALKYTIADAWVKAVPVP